MPGYTRLRRKRRLLSPFSLFTMMAHRRTSWTPSHAELTSPRPSHKAFQRIPSRAALCLPFAASSLHFTFLLDGRYIVLCLCMRSGTCVRCT
uniref:Uncharacterized protein n=1 Tax=Rhipicephalus zambeziensis TaxID=60191 RepID=A0A224Y5Z9_9ACAR